MNLILRVVRENLYRRSLDDREDVLFSEDEQLVAVDLDLVACVRGEDHPVARLHLDGRALAVVEKLAVADRLHDSLARLFLRLLGEDDPSLGLLLGVETADDDLVVERTQA